MNQQTDEESYKGPMLAPKDLDQKAQIDLFDSYEINFKLNPVRTGLF